MNILMIFPQGLQLLFPTMFGLDVGGMKNITCPGLFSLWQVWILSQNNEAQKVKRGSRMKYRWKLEIAHTAWEEFLSKNSCLK